MSLANFRLAFLDQLLAFLWRQWSQLGVLGETAVEDEWVLDPEALLAFSLQLARYEPRLFDEILSWLLINGDKLDASRLKNIVKQYSANETRIIGAALQFVIRHADKRKWDNLASYCAQLWKKQPRADSVEPLFRRREDGVPYPLVGLKEKDPDFSLFFLDRPLLQGFKESRAISVNARTHLRFLLRPLFGIGGRAECLLYLLTHEGGRPRDISEAAGLFWLGIQQTLKDLSNSGLVLTRQKGKRVEYWLSHKRWWDFLSFTGQEIVPPKWLNWIAIYSALWTVWQTLDSLARGAESDYLKASKLHDSLEVLEREFTRAGYDLPRIPSMGLTPDLYQHTAIQFLDQIFKVQCVPTAP
ncbi:MAG: hypothetical protein HYZ73_06700 [Elusimicrobia bacterium]|nr:hypothetical protein [Elusimicrobiota bacterium]